MIEYRDLTEFTFEQYLSLGHNGYTTDSIYKINTLNNNGEVTFGLSYTKLDKPFVKTYPVNESTFDDYSKLISKELSIGAYENDILVGALIAKKNEWNNSLWIEFIEVAQAHRGKGIGTQLLNYLFQKTKDMNFRIAELETQNINVPAINFYRKNGFEITGINITLYNNPDNKDETAIYMTTKL